MKIKKLLGARLLVRPEYTKDKTAGGIILPGILKQRTEAGLVLAAGRGHVLRDGTPYSCCAKAGQRILYGRRSGLEIEQDGEKLVIIRDEEVVAVVKERKLDVKKKSTRKS